MSTILLLSFVVLFLGQELGWQKKYDECRKGIIKKEVTITINNIRDLEENVNIEAEDLNKCIIRNRKEDKK